MTNPNAVPIVPIPGPNDNDATPPATREVDGETQLDPDINDDLIDSAEADRLAAGSGDEKE